MDSNLPFFGYGSLLWRPGFSPARTHHGRLDGFIRSFCMHSVHHRGTRDRPGLVLALDRNAGSCCEGILLWAAPAEFAGVLAEIRERELVTSAYREEIVEVDLRGGGRTEAIAYVVDRNHSQYCGELPPERQAGIIARASGISGENRDYLRRTVRRLSELGISDSGLAEIDRLVAEFTRP